MSRKPPARQRRARVKRFRRRLSWRPCPEGCRNLSAHRRARSVAADPAGREAARGPVLPARDPYKYFRVEARELLEALGRGVLDLEKGARGPELVVEMLRLAHTLKGAARIVGRIE